MCALRKIILTLNDTEYEDTFYFCTNIPIHSVVINDGACCRLDRLFWQWLLWLFGYADRRRMAIILFGLSVADL